MALAELVIRGPVKVTMFFILVILLGWISLRRLPVNLFPDMQTPRITMEVRSNGLSPNEVERRIAQPFERALFTVRGAVDVKSTSRADSAVLAVDFTWDTPMEYAFLDVKKAVAEVQRQLGNDIESVSVLRYDPNARPVMTLALSGTKEYDQEELHSLAKRILEPALERIDGVASVVVTGGEERELLIQLDETRMLADKLDVNRVSAAIRNSNVNSSGGWVEESARRFVLKAVGEVRSPVEVGDIVVGRRGTLPIKLSEIATIGFTPKERTSMVRLDGKPAIGLSIYKESSGNTVGVAKGVRAEMEDLGKILPKGAKIAIAQDQSHFITAAIDEVRDNAIVGAILSVAVLFIFLRDPRSVAVIGLAIPISIIATFNLMYFLDISLNVMSLGGLALGVGMLVDCAIVALENIHRLHTLGHDARTAAVRGVTEVGGALLASTLTTVVVYLPIVYVHGVAGLLFKEHALTVSFSLLASLVVAVLLVPLLAYWMFRTSEQVTASSSAAASGSAHAATPAAAALPAGTPAPAPANTHVPIDAGKLGWMWRKYLATVRWCLAHRAIVFGISILLLIASALEFLRIPQEFFPRTPQKEVRMRMVLPPSATLEYTDHTVRLIEDYLKDYKSAISTIYTRVGQSEETSVASMEDPDGPNTAELVMGLRDQSEMTTATRVLGVKQFTSLDLVERLQKPLATLTDVRATIEAQQGNLLELLGSSNVAPLVVELRGSDSRVLTQLAQTTRATLEKVPGLQNVRTNITEGAPEAVLFLDPTALSFYGFDTRSLASAISDRLQGSVASILKYETGDVNMRVRVLSPNSSLSTLEQMVFLSPSGARVTLNSIARIEMQRGPREIVRRRQERCAYVFADLDRIPLSLAIERSQAAIEQVQMPRGYRVAFTGEEQEKKEAFGRLGFALVLSIILVYMVMAAIFESFVQPFLILLTIPLGMVGVVWGLVLAGQTLNVMAYMGIVMLGGIVVNNAIVLLDCVNQMRSEGMEDRESLIQASQQRLRPVLMTTLTTTLGLIPLGLGIGEGAELRQAMAVSVIGGMITSTILTLLVIPCCQSVWDDVRSWITRVVFRRRPGASTSGTPLASK